MKREVNWIYNDCKQIGIDYTDIEKVEEYDKEIGCLRDLHSEFNYILKEINLKNVNILLEIGTGTGEFAIRASKVFEKVYAIDISQNMIDYAKKKATFKKIKNIEFLKASFLNFKFKDLKFDAIISQLALHHLPDFWKQIAIDNIYKHLKIGGKFIYGDTILSFDTKKYREIINHYIDNIKKEKGEKISNEVIINIRDEYPTFDWIIEGMLKRSGFGIDNILKYNEYISMYTCTKLVRH